MTEHFRKTELDNERERGHIRDKMWTSNLCPIRVSENNIGRMEAIVQKLKNWIFSELVKDKNPQN